LRSPRPAAENAAVRFLRFGLPAVLLAATVAAAPAGSDLARVRQTHRLRVLTDLSDPNDLSRLIYRSGAGYDGIEYEILRSFARTLDDAQLDVAVVPSFDALFPALARGEGDVVAASLTDTPERRASMDLSESYFPVREMVIVRRGETAKSFAALAGRRAMTQKGTTWQRRCREAPGARLLYSENQADLFRAVADGRADFAVVDSPMAVTYLEKYPGLVIAWSLPEAQSYAFALRRGSDLKPLLDEHLRKLKSTGVYYALLGRFYGRRGLAILRASESSATPGAPQK
jgi:ABC-type amino acid transport substrate-binding protein